jgi:hypothetical protein
MANRNEPTHIFHLYRKDGTAVFLHPFRNISKLHAMLTKGEIVGHYGQEPRVESLTMFRNELYRLVEQEVKAWVADARFIPRFVISAGAFLVVFLFMGIVLPDPIALLDEIAIALGGSILVYILLGRKDMQSDIALKRRIELRNKVDSIVFTENAFVERVERMLIEREGDSPAELIDETRSSSGSPEIAGFEQESSQMVSHLEQMLSASEYRQTEKRLKRLQKDDSDRSRESLQKWLDKQKVDLPLLSIYLSLKKKTSSLR